METKDFVTLGISSLALLLSGFAALLTWRSNVATFRNVARNNYMSALFDLNRQLIAHPTLWATYDSAAIEPADGPLEAIRRRAFIWYHLNVFEVVRADYTTHRLTRLNRADQLCWESWDNFISYLLKSSPEARELVTSDESMALLRRDFVTYLRSKMA